MNATLQEITYDAKWEDLTAYSNIAMKGRIRLMRVLGVLLILTSLYGMALTRSLQLEFVVFLICATAMLVFSRGLLSWGVRRMFMKAGVQEGRRVVHFGAEGIDVESPGMKTHVRYGAVRNVIDTPGHVIIVAPAPIAIPRRAIPHQNFVGELEGRVRRANGGA